MAASFKPQENAPVKSKNDNLPRTKINLLILAYIAFVTLGLPTGLLGVAWPTLRAGFSLPLDAMGFLLFSSTVGYLISSFFIARLINRFGIGPLLIFSSVASAISLVGYTIAPAWSVIVAIGCIGGFGSGVMDAGLNTYLAAEYNEAQMQWLHACYGIGATLSPIVMTASLAQFVSWRPGYIFVGILTVIMAISFWADGFRLEETKESLNGKSRHRARFNGLSNLAVGHLTPINDMDQHFDVLALYRRGIHLRQLDLYASYRKPRSESTVSRTLGWRLLGNLYYRPRIGRVICTPHPA